MSTRSSSKNGGFALVIALSLMAFVLLLLLSISTIVQVEQSSAAISKAKLQSEQSALLALHQALGALQAEMGPDQRISANADILSAQGSGLNTGNLSSDNAMTVEHPFLVGAWDSSGDASKKTIFERRGKKWEIGDTVGSNYYSERATKGFRRWLISDDGDGGNLDTSDMSFASDTTFGRDGTLDSFMALGEGTLGTNLTDSELEDLEIWAPLQEVTTGTGSQINSRMGWVVLDENVKARMNQSHQLATNPSTSSNPRPEDLIAWDNPGDLGIEAISDLAEFDRASVDVDKVSSYATAALYMETLDSNVDADTFGPYYHDLSFHSAGVMADVVNGGLKRDLSTLAEELPSDYIAGRRLYSDDVTGHSDNPNADPHWSAILDYIGLYKQRSSSDDPDFGDIALLENNGASLPVAQMNTTEWAGNRATRAGVDEPFPAPTTYRLAPAVAQFETYFSFLALRPHAHGFAENIYRGEGDSIASKYATSPTRTYSSNSDVDYHDETRQLHLCMTPVITLYNPYSVPIEFKEMWVVFRDIPVGMRLSRYSYNTDTAVPLTTDFVPLSAMNSLANKYGNFPEDGSQRFKMRLSSDADASNNDPDPVKLAPGESIVFSPYYPPSQFINELDNWHSEKNGTMEAKPGYSEGVGLYWDAFAPSNRWSEEDMIVAGLGGRTGTDIITATATQASYGQWFLLMNQFDRVKVELGFVDGTEDPLRLPGGGAVKERNGTFSVELFSKDPNMAVSTSDGSANANMIGRYTFDYNTDFDKGNGIAEREIRKGTLDDALPLDQDVNLIALEDLRYQDINPSNFDRNAATVANVDATTFGAFRVGGKITKQTSGESFQPAVASAFTNTTVFSGHHRVNTDSPALGSYDFSIRVPDGGVGTIRPEVDSAFRGRFFSGYTSVSGAQYGTQLEVPVTPLQSIGSLQHANVAASGYLPHISHAVGNSWAHPLIASDQAVNTTGPYGYFDHSYIANTQLWDSYYFSTIADQLSAYDTTGSSFDDTVNDFLAGEPLPNSTFKLHLPLGIDKADVSNNLISIGEIKEDAYLKVAGYQLQEGTFNINSTSVEAWKAILATTNIANPIIKQPIYSDPNSANQPITFNAGSGNLAAIYTRFSIANYDQSFDSATSNEFAIWQGYRELDNDIINQLAADIVDQVRARGPFLSLAEFVNRRLANESDTRAQMGAIDAAIAASDSNTSINNTLTTNAGEDILGSINSHITGFKDFSTIVENQTAVSGNTARGITSYLTQADILQQIGSRLSARSDTFVIRAYGDVVHPITGDITASSLCEAVVQRIPDYVDTSLDQTPDFDGNTDFDSPGPDGLSDANEQFGRRFKIVQLNWLNPSDV